jgi:hypothetical protein
MVVIGGFPADSRGFDHGENGNTGYIVNCLSMIAIKVAWVGADIRP